MNYLLLGILGTLAGAGMYMWFSTFPESAAVFPKLIAISCFALPGVASVVKGIRDGDAARLSPDGFSKFAAGIKESNKSKGFWGTWALFAATVLYVVGTYLIGFFPSTALYFLAVLLGIYRMPIKGTLIYSISSVAFLYIFFAVIFHIPA